MRKPFNPPRLTWVTFPGEKRMKMEASFCDRKPIILDYGTTFYEEDVSLIEFTLTVRSVSTSSRNS